MQAEKTATRKAAARPATLRVAAQEAALLARGGFSLSPFSVQWTMWRCSSRSCLARRSPGRSCYLLGVLIGSTLVVSFCLFVTLFEPVTRLIQLVPLFVVVASFAVYTLVDVALATYEVTNATASA